MLKSEISRELQDLETSVVHIRTVPGLGSCVQTEVNIGSLGKGVRTG